nr:helix-turn-helix transcriptional regulator [uncultured Mediterraneibacter sp.]
MEINKDYWTPILNDFINDYPNMGDEIAKWYPCGRYEICIELKNGRKYIYDMIERFPRPVSDDISSVRSEEEWRKNFSIKLRKRLSEVSMDQEELSERANLSRITVSKYVRGISTPSAYNLLKIATVLRSPLSELVY